MGHRERDPVLVKEDSIFVILYNYTDHYQYSPINLGNEMDPY